MKSPGMSKSATIDEYLAGVSADKRAALQFLRRAIKAAAPGAVECISYGIPAFRLDGKLLVHFGAAAKHCAFYPGAVVDAHADDLRGYDTSKGTIRFQPDTPLPSALVRKLVRAQVARRVERKPRPAAKATRRARRRPAVTADDLRRIALGHEGTVEGAHMGHPDFRVNGRIFATLHAGNRTGMVKVTPEQQQDFIREHPRAFAPESGAWGRQGCTRVHLAHTDEEALGEALTLAWQHAVRSRAGRP